MKFALVAALVLAAGFSGCARTSESPSASVSESAPSLVLPVAGENRMWSLDSYLGNKTVLLAFYTTWCPYCNKSMPYIESYYEKNRDKDFEVIGIDLEEPEETALAFKKKYGLSFPVLLGESSKLAGSYPVRYLPTLYLIGKDGKLLHTFEGFNPSVFDDITKALGS